MIDGVDVEVLAGSRIVLEGDFTVLMLDFDVFFFFFFFCTFL